MAVEYEKFNGTGNKKDNSPPLTIPWGNSRMVRNHSLRAVAREILRVNRGIQVVRINVIGPPSTGKTELARTLGHLIHDLADEPYAVKILTRDELMDMEETLSHLEPVNHFLWFDDVSWLSATANKQKLDQLQKTFTEIRHLPGGQDIKVVAGFNFHYNLSIPKHLRQADFFFYTSIGSSELENTQKLVGTKNTAKLLEFRKIYQESISSGKEATENSPAIPATFSYRLPGKGNKKFTYTWRQPFAPALFWNNDTLRHIVFPTREWIIPVCQTCAGSIAKSKEESMDVKKFKEAGLAAFGKGSFYTALRVKMMQMGVYTWNPAVKQAMTWIERYMQHKNFNFDDIVKEFDFKDKRTRLGQKLPKEILES